MKFYREKLIQVACETLQALAFLNHHSILHRSLDPENILLDDQVSWIFKSLKLSTLFQHCMFMSI